MKCPKCCSTKLNVLMQMFSGWKIQMGIYLNMPIMNINVRNVDIHGGRIGLHKWRCLNGY